MMSDAEILDLLTIPGLNVEAAFEPRELPILLDGIRGIVALERRRERDVIDAELRRLAYALHRERGDWL